MGCERKGEREMMRKIINGTDRQTWKPPDRGMEVEWA
jgi:hypothetical protein